MNIQNFLKLAAIVVPTMELAARQAEDAIDWSAINQTANLTLRGLNAIANDESFAIELRTRAAAATPALREICRQSCEAYEALGGFGYDPKGGHQ